MVNISPETYRITTKIFVIISLAALLIICGLAYLGYSKKYKPNIYRLRTNKAIPFGIFMTLLLVVALGLLKRRIGDDLFDGLLNISSFALNIFVAYLAIKFIDNYDLHKGYKAAEHEAVLEFVKDLNSLHITIMSKPSTAPMIYYHDIFNLQYILETQISIKEKELNTKKLFFTKDAQEKLQHLLQITLHPYFPNPSLKYLFSEMSWSRYKLSEVEEDSLIFSDYHYSTEEASDLIELDPDVFVFITYNFTEKTCGNFLDFLLRVSQEIEYYYLSNMPKFTPYSLRRKGKFYM